MIWGMILEPQISRRNEPRGRAGALIQHLLFLAYIIGALIAIDATFFAGEYRTAALTVGWPVVWQDVTYRGRAFNVDVERWLRKSLW